ncbi:hypothetical protein PAL_GLEAN10019284 [Pteropus alecto]|uniref:Uncharacterized protein n=1 Tax=Pteropus alecto TaxID=9402 RepID=L5JSG7_PTEAL|nr:hypothetical protein PAL_GLEAN10019284 [Pteropus alecto]
MSVSRARLGSAPCLPPSGCGLGPGRGSFPDPPRPRGLPPEPQTPGPGRTPQHQPQDRNNVRPGHRYSAGSDGVEPKPHARVELQGSGLCRA